MEMLTADDWIKKLELVPHPEGGFFREFYRSDEIYLHSALPKRYTSDRSFCTSIYYLLKRNQYSAFHKIKSDEIWHFYSGCNLIIHIIENNGIYRNVVLGSGNDQNSMPQFIIPKNTWFAAEAADKKGYSLVGCTVSPGFDFSDFKLGRREELISEFPMHSKLISKFTHK
jgi:predicted cupin superfamily sugar epimerase